VSQDFVVFLDHRQSLLGGSVSPSFWVEFLVRAGPQVTGCKMIIGIADHLYELRRINVANPRHRNWAPRVEPATRWWVDRIRNLAGRQRLQTSMQRIGHRDGIK
jgi:hypothetical protein